MPRPRTHDAELRRRLLAVAGAELSTHGADGLSLRGLARSAETTTRAVYSLFGSKEALLDAVVDEAFSRFATDLAAVGETEDPRDDLLRLGHAYRASALADPHSYWIMFGTAASRVAVSAGVRSRAAATFQPLRGVVQRAVQQEVLRSADPDQLASAMWATVHGVVSLELAGLLGDADPAELFEASMRASIAGWSPEHSGTGAQQV